MNLKFNFKNLSIKMSLILPLGIAFFILFIFLITFLIADQSSKKNKELRESVETTSQLIAMTNISNVWNIDTSAMEQNLTQFLKEKDAISIELKDAQGNSIIKKEEPKIGKLISKKVDIIHEGAKIGEADISFTDYYIKRDVGGMALQLIIMGIIIMGVMILILFIITNFIANPISKLKETAGRIAKGEMDLQADAEGKNEVATLAAAFNSMTTQLKSKAEGFRKNNEILLEIISKAKEIIVKLNSSSKEIEAATQEQTSASNEHASGITEVSATLEELTITAKQITKNVGELVFSSEEVTKQLHESGGQLLETVSLIDEVGKISANNTAEIGELGKRSILINEMVELIKEVANKTNILSINASIEASRSGEAGTGFTVVAAEIRELSKETITSAKKVETAAREIQDFLNSIIISSESESAKVIDTGKTVKKINSNIEDIVKKIGNNYSFTQKIDVSIKQQESGSKQAADTMKQMAEIARQSAETARQTLLAVKDIVSFSAELDEVVKKFKAE